jgi:hypothetical protein
MDGDCARPVTSKLSPFEGHPVQRKASSGGLGAIFDSADLVQELVRHVSLDDLPALVTATRSSTLPMLPAPLHSVLPVLHALREPWIDLVWVAVLGGRVELLRWLLQSGAAAAERQVRLRGITPLMYAREAGQAESASLLAEWGGQTGLVQELSRVEGGTVVMATTQRYAAVVVADDVLRGAQPRTAAQPIRPGMAPTVRIARLACGWPGDRSLGQEAFQGHAAAGHG